MFLSIVLAGLATLSGAAIPVAPVSILAIPFGLHIPISGATITCLEIPTLKLITNNEGERRKDLQQSTYADVMPRLLDSFSNRNDSCECACGGFPDVRMRERRVSYNAGSYFHERCPCRCCPTPACKGRGSSFETVISCPNPPISAATVLDMLLPHPPCRLRR
jgi:hypothetical protein